MRMFANSDGRIHKSIIGYIPKVDLAVGRSTFLRVLQFNLTWKIQTYSLISRKIADIKQNIPSFPALFSNMDFRGVVRYTLKDTPCRLPTVILKITK